MLAIVGGAVGLVIIIVVLVVVAGSDADEVVSDAKELWEEGEFHAAAELYEEACNDDLAEGCFLLGNALSSVVLDDAQDEKKAEKTFIKSCDLDWAMACESLGHDYSFRDKVKALGYYKRACELDAERGLACASAGSILLNGGGGVDKDEAAAVHYLEIACDERQETTGCATLQAHWELKYQFSRDQQYQKKSQRYRNRVCELDPDFVAPGVSGKYCE